MSPLIDALLVVVLLLNFFALGTSRISAVIRIVALQGVVLAAASIIVHREIHVRTLFLAAGMIGLKGAGIPLILHRAMREAHIRREVEPLISLTSSMVLGAVGTALAVALVGTLPLAPGAVSALIIPAAFSTLLTGFLLLTTRIKAISQVTGYLFLENGIFLFGLLLIEAVPFLVEIGVLLDLFVAVFIISIIIHHISREFASLDTRKLTTLRE